MEPNVCESIASLVEYAIQKGLAEEADRIYLQNRLMEEMGLEMELGRKEVERERMERLNWARRRGRSVEFGVLREMQAVQHG